MGNCFQLLQPQKRQFFNSESLKGNKQHFNKCKLSISLTVLVAAMWRALNSDFIKETSGCAIKELRNTLLYQVCSLLSLFPMHTSQIPATNSAAENENIFSDFISF